jgi:hypothetical protein
MKPGPLIMLVLGIVLAVAGLGLTVTGTVVGVAAAVQGENGYFTSRTASFAADSYALTSPPLGAATGTTAPFNLDIARVRLEATGAGDEAVFIGIAPRADVERYLENVEHSEVRGIQTDPFRVRYVTVPGTDRPTQPEREEFWAVSASGPGTQEVVWPVQPGPWSVVVMNADASRPVAVDLSAGVRSGLLAPIALTLLLVGIFTLIAGLVLVVLGAIGLGRNGPAPSNRLGPPDAVPAGGAPGAAPGAVPAPPGTAAVAHDPR